MPPPLPGEPGGPPAQQVQVVATKPVVAAKPPAPQAAPVSKPSVTVNAPVVTPPTTMSVSQDDKETMAMIMKHEGVRTKPYKDSLGLWTVGVGHLIGDGKTLPPEWNREFTMEEVNKMFYDDYMSHKKAAMRIPGFNLVNAKAQGALIDLTFNMGNYWYNNWNKFKAAMANGDVLSAAAELENSKWYTQVKSRAVTIVSLIKQGATNAVGIPSSPTTGIKTAQASAEVNSAKKQQSGQTTYNINNSTTTAVKVEGASQGGSVTVARPVGTA
jgi:lysozyme